MEGCLLLVGAGTDRSRGCVFPAAPAAMGFVLLLPSPLLETGLQGNRSLGVRLPGQKAAGKQSNSTDFHSRSPPAYRALPGRSVSSFSL